MISYQNRPENEIDIALSDGKEIHGILRGEIDNEKPVVVMMHGLPGSNNELLQYLGAHYLSEHDITTLRISMYDFGQKYRSLIDCTLDTHIADFEDVVRYLRENGAKRVFALGQSYGGITILGSKVALDGAVLWDPSHGLAWQDPEFDSPDFPEQQYGDLVVGTGGYGYIESKKMHDGNQSIGDTTKWAANKGYPLKFITAGAGPLSKYVKQYYEAADSPKELVMVENAHHQFEDSDDVTERLFVETLEFISK
jgi:hypothetical protein